jgi:hypothetical protein
MVERSFLLTDLVIITICHELTSEIAANHELAIVNQILVKSGGKAAEMAENGQFQQNALLKGHLRLYELVLISLATAPRGSMTPG